MSNTTITTPSEAMEASTRNCEKSAGDQPCIDILGAGACCFKATVDSIPSNRTDAAKSNDMGDAELGWPSTAGEENEFCLGSTDITLYKQEDETLPFEQVYTKIMMKGYCVGATKLAGAASAAAAVMFAAAF